MNCGGTLYAMSGILETPNWPESAPANQLCQWAIVLPNPDSRVKIVVNEVDIQISSSGTCFWNYMMILDTAAQVGSVPPFLLNRICGTSPPTEELIATGNTVHVWYYSRHTSSRGFSLQFSDVL